MKLHYPFQITKYGINEYGKIEISEIRVYKDSGEYLKTITAPNLERFLPYLAKNDGVFVHLDLNE